MADDFKPIVDEPNPEQNNAGTKGQERSVSGDVQVSGEVFIQLSPEIALRKDAADEVNNVRENKKYRLEKTSLAVLSLYAALTAVQSCQSIRSANAAKDAANAAAKAANIASESLYASNGPGGQVDRTMTQMIDQTIIQSDSARATQKAAKAAESAAQTASRQAQTSENQLEISQRPWLEINTTIASGITYNVNGANIVLSLTVKNTGQTPALNAMLLPKIIALGLHTPDARTQARQLCTEFMPKQVDDFGMATYFPNNPQTENFNINLPYSEIQSKSADPDFFLPAVIVCVTYKSSFNPDKWYYTAMIYDLDYVQAGVPGIQAMRRYVPVPKESLLLQPEGFPVIAK